MAPLLLATVLMSVASVASASELIYGWAPTEFRENDESISLEVIVFKPFGPGPFPTLMFNHGSTGEAANPAYFERSYSAPSLAFWFNERGWLVAFPQRRGRGRSDGRYDEGLDPSGSGYSCRYELAVRGLERALQDVDQAVRYLRGRSDVDGTRMLIGGQSRGGLLSIVYAGTHPERFGGVINFVGGWVGERCREMEVIHTAMFRRGGSFRNPTLWLYGENDSTYGIAHSRNSFDAFVAEGGKGSFRSYSLGPAKDGHNLLYEPELWRDAVDVFIADLLAAAY